MKQKIVAAVVQGMLPYLNNAQTEKLQEVLLHALWDYDISVSDGKAEKQEQDLLALFLAAKRIEGCSEKSLNYYQANQGDCDRGYSSVPDELPKGTPFQPSDHR